MAGVPASQSSTVARVFITVSIRVDVADVFMIDSICQLIEQCLCAPNRQTITLAKLTRRSMSNDAVFCCCCLDPGHVFARAHLFVCVSVCVRCAHQQTTAERRRELKQTLTDDSEIFRIIILLKLISSAFLAPKWMADGCERCKRKTTG